MTTMTRQTIAGALALAALAFLARSAYRHRKMRREREGFDKDVSRWEQEGGSVETPPGPAPVTP